MTVFTNSRLFDGETNGLKTGLNVYVKGDRISEVSDRPPTPDDGETIDCGGRTLMPGLIDAHIHAYAWTVNANEILTAPPALYISWASGMLRNMIDRGFTTVRDTGGADYGLYLALQKKFIVGPRLYYCGKGISQTGGHLDLRHPHHHSAHDEEMLSCGCGIANQPFAVVDGVDAVRRVVRDNLRHGASFIKFAGSGGVSSTGDPLHAIQFSDEEVSAIVDEVNRHGNGVYCTAHIHPDAALKRAVKLGVHCIEHGTLIEADTARMVTDADVYIVPTLAVIAALGLEGKELGYPPQALAKLDMIKDEAVGRLRHMKDAGVKIGLGTDLLGRMERHQCIEFGLRRAFYSSFEILVQATSMNAEILGAKGHLGVIKKGALADILLVDGDPLADVTILEQAGKNIPAIMQAGAFYKRTLPA